MLLSIAWLKDSRPRRVGDPKLVSNYPEPVQDWHHVARTGRAEARGEAGAQPEEPADRPSLLSPRFLSYQR